MLKKINTMCSKGAGFIYAWMKSHKKHTKRIDNKRILIIFGGRLGNAVLNVDALLELKKIYPEAEGYRICVICSRNLKNICSMIADMSGFEFLDVYFPFEDGGTRYRDVRRTLNALKGMEFETIIVNLAHIMPLAGYIVGAVPANKSVGVFDDIKHEAQGLSNIEHNVGNLRWYFERKYTNPIYVPINTQEVWRQKLWLHEIGDDSYKVKIYHIDKQCDYDIPDSKYITVTLDSSSSKKRWNTEKFAELVNRITDETDYTVCFTGAQEYMDLFKQCLEKITKPERILCYIGKTSIREWIELIRGSSLHIGVDSGSIHIAASVGTQSICISCVWDGHRVMPYIIEEKTDNTKEPICVYIDDVDSIECYACYPNKGVIGGGNDECMRDCIDGKPCRCLSQISVDKVFAAVNKCIKNS